MTKILDEHENILHIACKANLKKMIHWLHSLYNLFQVYIIKLISSREKRCTSLLSLPHRYV